MSATEPSPPVTPRRLHPLGALLSAGRMLWGLWPLLIAALIQDSRVPLFGFLLGGVPLVIGLGILSWWRFTWWTHGDELRIERGLFVRKRVYIHRERIQAVEIHAGLVQQLAGLVKVRVKTEASETQAELAAVRRADAEQLAAFLQPDVDRTTSSAVPTGPAVRRWSLSTRELVLAATTSGRFGALLTLVGWAYAQFNDLIDPRLRSSLEAIGAHGTELRSPSVIGALILVAMFVSWVTSVAAEIVRFAAFHIERRGENLVVARGLLERRETVIPRDRVHAIRIVEGLLRQPLGYAAVFVEASGHAGEKGQSTVLHPFLHRTRLRLLIADLLPALSDEPLDAPIVSPPSRARLRFFARPALVLATMAALGLWLWTPLAIIAAVVATPMLGLAWLAWLETGLRLGPRTAIVRRRQWGRRETVLVPRRRVQAAQAATSLLQRRRKLTSCRLVIASGDGARVAEARDLDDAQGDQLLRWI